MRHVLLQSSLHNKFHIAAAHNNFRWVGHSCNGFSSGVKVEDFNGALSSLSPHCQRPPLCQV